MGNLWGRKATLPCGAMARANCLHCSSRIFSRNQASKLPLHAHFFYQRKLTAFKCSSNSAQIKWLAKDLYSIKNWLLPRRNSVYLSTKWCTDLTHSRRGEQCSNHSENEVMYRFPIWKSNSHIVKRWFTGRNGVRTSQIDRCISNILPKNTIHEYAEKWKHIVGSYY